MPATKPGRLRRKGGRLRSERMVAFNRNPRPQSSESALYLRPFTPKLATRHIHELIQHLNADQSARGQKSFGLFAARIIRSECIDQDIGIEEWLSVHSA